MALGHTMWLPFVLFFPVQATNFCLTEFPQIKLNSGKLAKGRDVCIGPSTTTTGNWDISVCSRLEQPPYKAGRFGDPAPSQNCESVLPGKDFPHYFLDQAGMEFYFSQRSTTPQFVADVEVYLARNFAKAAAPEKNADQMAGEPQKFVAVSGLLGWSGGVGANMPIFVDNLISDLDFKNPVWLRTPDRIHSYLSGWKTSPDQTMEKYEEAKASHINADTGSGNLARFMTGLLTARAVSSGWDVVLDSADFLATTANLKQLASAKVDGVAVVRPESLFRAYFFEPTNPDANVGPDQIKSCSANILAMLEAEKKTEFISTGPWATARGCAGYETSLTQKAAMKKQDTFANDVITSAAKWMGVNQELKFKGNQLLLNTEQSVSAGVFWAKVWVKPGGWGLAAVEKIFPAPSSSAAFVEVQPPVLMPTSSYQNSALQVEEVAGP